MITSCVMGCSLDLVHSADTAMGLIGLIAHGIGERGEQQGLIDPGEAQNWSEQLLWIRDRLDHDIAEARKALTAAGRP